MESILVNFIVEMLGYVICIVLFGIFLKVDYFVFLIDSSKDIVIFNLCILFELIFNYIVVF